MGERRVSEAPLAAVKGATVVTGKVAACVPRASRAAEVAPRRGGGVHVVHSN